MRLTLLILLMAFSQGNSQKTLQAYRTNTAITMDGILDEADWSFAEIGTDFTTTNPVPGEKPDQKTEVRML